MIAKPQYGKMRFPSYSFTVLFFSFLLLGCAGRDVIKDRSYHEFETAPLMGMIYSSENSPCSGVTVELLKDGLDEAASRGQSDINGRFMLPRLKKGTNRIRLAKRGYQTLTVALDFSDPTQVFYARLLSLEDLLLETEESIDAGQWEDAQDRLNEAEQIDEKNGEALFLQAVIYAATDRGRRPGRS